MLAPGGICVLFGASAGVSEVTFDTQAFFRSLGQLHGFILFGELGAKPASQGLERLARLISDGQLRTFIDVEADWTQIGQVAQKLLNRQITGKAVLHVSG
jgi:NADPH:quinone reductase-like Zn-dependent oxidoreductase